MKTSSIFSRDLSPEFEWARGQTSDYEFLDRSPRPPVERIRVLIEEWLSRMPETERPRLLASLRSRKNLEHWSGFFELYCHEFLRRSGFEVEMHTQDIKKRAKDFRASRGGFVFEMEAAVCADSDQHRAEQRILNRVTDFLDEHAFVPGFRYSMQLENVGSELPPLRELSAQIKAWAEGFDRAAIRELLEGKGYEVLPVRTFTEGEWSLEMTLIPRPIDESDSEIFKKSIGIGPVQVGRLQHDKALWNTLKSKSSHYAQHDHPFVIAVDTVFSFGEHNEIDVLQALLGTEQVTVDVRTMKTKLGRASDGIWIGPRGPRNKRVSAVLMVNQLRSYYIPKAALKLYVNPWAIKPLAADTFFIPTVSWDLDTGKKTEKSGKTPWEIFGLSQNWPEEAE